MIPIIYLGRLKQKLESSILLDLLTGRSKPVSLNSSSVVQT